jgi:hypothetical protein
MLNTLAMRLTQVAEGIKAEGWASTVREVIFLGRTAVFVEKDLADIVDRPAPLANAGLELLEIDDRVASSGAYRFSLKNRHLKALRNLRKGAVGFGIVRDHVVVGDLWCWTSQNTGDRDLYPDLKRFGVEGWADSYVYTFDIQPGEFLVLGSINEMRFLVTRRSWREARD